VLACAAEASLFHTADGKGYADIVINNHRETWPIRSPSFRKWLLHQFYEREGSIPGREPLRAALDTFEARAQFEGEEREVFLRVGGHRGKIYLDLADEDWRAIEIDADGWRVITNPPVRFRRAPGMKALPAPVMAETKRGIRKLRRFVNLPGINPDRKSIYHDPEFILYVIYIVAALRDHGPYPGLSAQGEEGTAKTTLMEVARALIDPTSLKERHPPSSPRDLFIATRNGYMLNYGNMSKIADWLSNALCTISTGGSFATRELYSDAEETLFQACRPVALNGIKFAVEPDLAQRLIFLHPPVIPNDERKLEKEFWREFEAERPLILGAVLNILVHGLKNLPEVQADDLLRMADFHLFGIACEGALWREGAFDRAYRANQRKAIVAVVDEDEVADAIRTLVTADEPKWNGTIGQLLNALSQLVSERQSKNKEWPSSARALTGRLAKLTAALRRVGISVEYGGKSRRGRTITITRSAKGPETSSPSSHRHQSNEINGIGGDDAGDRVVPVGAARGRRSGRER
jgi:hypothetical protein